eukprot:Protomagalhaensia_sp_Gyna_25__2160@NODE_2173_length_1244_cov_783_777593_g1796_i0_p1_GENE_NODE_2173_length_1244_cov_783_777593_g1796_i0NODE_2173_length_1244_cov_783_777593_g1796_i0_p1_ORF_typecomplete_len236_score52_11_NODE_2173_length_1244_cov_783_777593_g1796_i085792
MSPKLRERLLSSLSKNGATTTALPPKSSASFTTPINKSSELPQELSITERRNMASKTTAGDEKPHTDIIKSLSLPAIPPVIKAEPTPLKTKPTPRPSLRNKERDQHKRLLKKLPQAKVLGEVNLENLMEKNDLVVIMHEPTGCEESSFDASVAEERPGTVKRLKSALRISGSQKLSKKVVFAGGDVEGREVSAIYLYEAVEVDAVYPLMMKNASPAECLRPAPPKQAPRIAFHAC